MIHLLINSFLSFSFIFKIKCYYFKYLSIRLTQFKENNYENQ